jgi:hypothetical protein
MGVIRAFTALVLLAGIGGAQPALAEVAKIRYLKMEPLAQYLMPDRAAEIALARKAAPDSISRDADVLVLGPHGFQTAVKGKNGFACMVARSWTSAADPDFWDPKVRVPMCFNPAAARSFLPNYLKRTDLILAGQSKEQAGAAIIAAIQKGELPAMEAGAMCYMQSKEGYGGDTVPHWPPHLMFFLPEVDVAFWGANLPGSPVFAIRDSAEHVTQFVVAVEQWSDGTRAAPAAQLPATDSHSH